MSQISSLNQSAGLPADFKTGPSTECQRANRSNRDASQPLVTQAAEKAASDTPPAISDAEWKVMHEVWQREPVTSSELIDRLTETAGWSQGTIKTLLHRLVQKRVLDFQRKGNRYIYRSNFSESDCVDEASVHLLHSVFHGRPLPMLTHLVHTARLSGSEVESLQSILNQIQQALPRSIDKNF